MSRSWNRARELGNAFPLPTERVRCEIAEPSMSLVGSFTTEASGSSVCLMSAPSPIATRIS